MTTLTNMCIYIFIDTHILYIDVYHNVQLSFSGRECFDAKRIPSSSEHTHTFIFNMRRYMGKCVIFSVQL